MAVTFNGPIKVSRPGFTQDGQTPNQGAVPNRQAWVAPVLCTIAVDIASGAGVGGAPVIPAGSLIQDITVLLLTGITGGGTLTYNLGGSAIATQAVGATGGYSNNPTVTAAQIPTWQNTGTLDAAFTISGVSTATGTVVVSFVPRNADGSLSDEGYRPFVQ